MKRQLITGTRSFDRNGDVKSRSLFKLRNFVTSSSYLLLVPSITLTESPKLTNPIKFPNLTSFLLEIVNTVIQYGAILIVFFIVFAGFKFVTAQGNSEKVSEARKMFTWIVIGAFVLLGVYVIKAAICGSIEKLGITDACKLTEQTTTPKN